MNISVIVTSYNQKAYLAQAIDSLLAQTLKPFEIIVCDDGSTDGSRELIRSYSSQYPGLFKIIFQPRNLGVTKNRNFGLKAAKGDFITTLDGDDTYAPAKLEKEVQAALESKRHLVYSNVEYMDWAGNKTGLRFGKRRLKQGDLFEDIATLVYPHPREVMISRDCLKTVGYQDEGLPINEDFEWVIRLAGFFEFAAVNQTLVHHRIHDRGLSQGSRLQLLTTQARVISKMVRQVESGSIQDRGHTLDKLKAFRDLTRAREFAFMEEKTKAKMFLAQSLAKDPWRSASYDLWLRMNIPWGFKRPHKIPDCLRIGPFALPYYFARALI